MTPVRGPYRTGQAVRVTRMCIFASRPVFAVVDTETTGLSPRRDWIVEVGVCLLDARFRPMTTWETLVNPGRPVTGTTVHGITDAMVHAAPPFAAVYTELAEILDGKILVAHNATFDAGFLDAEHARVLEQVGARGGEFGPGFVDTIQLAKQITHGPYSLTALSARYGVVNHGAHSAGGDAATTGRLLQAMAGSSRASIGKQIIAQAPPYRAAAVQALGLPRATAVPRPRAGFLTRFQSKG